jgi:LacI family transcriptional regulator
MPGQDARDPSAVTLADVARLAGVSAATVTRALHGSPRISAPTRGRVDEAARALGYVPHLGARALATRSSQTIGLLIPSWDDSFWGEVAQGLEERAFSEGFSVLLATSHGDAARERAMIDLFLGKRVDGIVIGGAAGMPAIWFPGGRPRTPIVLVDWHTPSDADEVRAATFGPIAETIARVEQRADSPYRHVCPDDVAGGGDLARHLLGLGHQRIAFAGVAPIRPTLLRLLGVRRVLEEAGLQLVDAIECDGSPDGSLEGGRSAGEYLLRAKPRPTAVVAFDDLIAVGIMRTVRAAGLSVPGDLSIVGFDDIPVAEFVEPPLTTYAQPKAAMGSLALQTVLDELRGSRETTPIRMPGHLVVRESAGRVASADAARAPVTDGARLR